MKMMRRLVKLIGLLVVGLTVLVGVNTTTANAADGAGFTVTAQLPDNQKNKDVSYFDLATKPGEKQKLTVTLKNTTTKTQTLLVSPNDAFTNSNGVIEYSKRNVKKSASAKYQFSDLIKEKTKKVDVAPDESKEVTFTLSVPKKGFKGDILGGFYVTPEEDKHQANNRSDGLGIENKFAMLVGAHLHGQGTAQPALKLNSVKPEVEDGQAVVAAQLENTQPVLFGKLQVKSTITKRGSDKVLYEDTKKDVSMAPNTLFTNLVKLDDDKFKAGDYTLKIAATRKGKTWHFSKNFTIDDNTTKLNNKLRNQPKRDLTWLYVSVGGVLVIIIAGLAFWWGRRKR